ncbi:hypothetical protein C1632_16530 [Microbacterium testaceum]|nr:hypothetical protein C1632_16530 [Microbacterium testaceum]
MGKELFFAPGTRVFNGAVIGDRGEVRRRYRHTADRRVDRGRSLGPLVTRRVGSVRGEPTRR